MSDEEAALLRMADAIAILRGNVDGLQRQVALQEDRLNRLSGTMQRVRAHLWPLDDQRNAEFIRRWQAGELAKDIGRDHGITGAAVTQIIAKARRRDSTIRFRGDPIV